MTIYNYSLLNKAGEEQSLKEFEETGEAEDWEVLKLKFKQKYGF